MASAEHHTNPDIVRAYHKLFHGTTEPTSSKKVLDSLEEQIILFLGKLFAIKGFEKPLKRLPKCMEACAKIPNIKEHDIVLYNVASLINELDDQLLTGALPLVANLVFMAKKDFSSVKTTDAQKLVLKIQKKFTSPAYVTTSFANARLQILLETVDSVRKYSEYLLRMGGYSLSIGRSPREIQRDLHRARNCVTR